MQKNKKIGPTENRTQVTRIKTSCDNHYTTGPSWIKISIMIYNENEITVYLFIGAFVAFVNFTILIIFSFKFFYIYLFYIKLNF